MTCAPGLEASAADNATAWLTTRSQGVMRPGSVLFHAPATVFQAPGGGENQLIQTGRALEDLGHVVRLFSCWTDRLDEARLLHLFGMSREGLELARMARALGVPVVLSPICWVEPRAIAANAPTPSRRFLERMKWQLRRFVPRLACWRRALLHLADAILPNSDAEGRQLAMLFGAERSRIHPVPNGVHPHFALADPAPFRERYPLGEFVLYVGRIEPRKNVLGLIEAIRPLGIPLVAIGAVPPSSNEYGRACRNAGGRLVHWLGSFDHDDPMLASAYAATSVLALPSWFETPGLAALEAAAAGTPVVVTPFGSAREYFGPLAEYARPDRPAEIREAVCRAMRSQRGRELSAHVCSRYAWSEVARRTAELYDQVTA
jgi:glycosyltransferase involved in cell wall biosynthesis